MKLNFKSIFYIALSASIVLASCKKNENVIGDSTGHLTGNQVRVNTTIVGVIVDESGSPISGAQVSVGTTVQFTDNYGNFIFDNINTNKERTFVKVSKSGFFDGSRVVKPFENQLTKISVMLQSNAYDGVISGTTGGSVSLTNGAKVELPANGVIVEATGAAYTGNVNVSMAYLDAGSSNMGALAPGDMMAIDANGDSRLLTSYGMLNVELTGDAGEKLQIANGSQATITIPTTISSAPSTIPLWYFDVVEGIWKEEGSATLQGNNYVGTVNHFTTWNCDWPERPVSVSGTILDCNGTPLVGVMIVFKRQNNGAFIGGAYTDSAGFYHGNVPFGVGLTLDILGSPSCNSPIFFSTNLGPYTSTQVIPTISVCNYNQLIVQGVLKNDCGQLAYALVYVYEKNTTNLVGSSLANLNYSIILCSSVTDVDIVSIPINNVSVSASTSINNLINNGVNTADTIVFCDTSNTIIDPLARIVVRYYGFGASANVGGNFISAGNLNGSYLNTQELNAINIGGRKIVVLQDLDTIFKIYHRDNAIFSGTNNTHYTAFLENPNVNYNLNIENTFTFTHNGNTVLYGDSILTKTISIEYYVDSVGKLQIISLPYSDIWDASVQGINSFGNYYSFFNNSVQLESTDYSWIQGSTYTYVEFDANVPFR